MDTVTSRFPTPNLRGCEPVLDFVVTTVAPIRAGHPVTARRRPFVASTEPVGSGGWFLENLVALTEMCARDNDLLRRRGTCDPHHDTYREIDYWGYLARQMFAQFASRRWYHQLRRARLFDGLPRPMQALVRERTAPSSRLDIAVDTDTKIGGQLQTYATHALRLGVCGALGVRLELLAAGRPFTDLAEIADLFS